MLSVLALIVLAAAIAAIIWFYNWYTYGRHVQNIAVIISTEKKDCADEAYPIYVFFGNRSSKTLERVTFTLRARIKGRSTNVAAYNSSYDDHISEPGFGYANCFAVPKLNEPVADPRSLEWDIEYKTVTFRN